MKATKICAIITGNNGKLLLQRRDENPEKGKWVLFGGGMMPGENEIQTLRRELEEELEYRAGGISFFKNYEDNGIRQAIYIVIAPVVGTELKLHEGQAMDFFAEEDLQTLEIGFNFKEIINDYLAAKRAGKL